MSKSVFDRVRDFTRVQKTAIAGSAALGSVTVLTSTSSVGPIVEAGAAMATLATLAALGHDAFFYGQTPRVIEWIGDRLQQRQFQKDGRASALARRQGLDPLVQWRDQK